MPTVDKVSLKNLECNPQDLNQLKMNITHTIKEVNERMLRKLTRNMVKRVDKYNEMNEQHFQHTTVKVTYLKYNSSC
jgi:hypothetical protein